jgi:acyl-CoA thioester hydrolase
MISKTIIVPRYKDTDQMGVVYHGNYITYFEQARSDFFKSIGFRYKELEDVGIILPVLEVGSTYLLPSYYDEPITVNTRLTEFSNVKIKLEYEIYNQNDELVNKGFTRHAFTSKDMKPINIKKLNSSLYNKIVEITK